MANHQKPTKEELAAQLEAITKELDAPEPPAEEPKKETPKKETPKKEEPKPSEPAPSEPPAEEPKPSEPAPSEPAPSEEPTPSPDYKEKFKHSSRENQKILAGSRKVNQAIDSAAEIPEPTPDEMKSLYPAWEDMTEVEQTVLKEAEVSKRWRTKISSAREEAKKIEKWEEQVETYIGNPKTLLTTPELEGKQEEFREFATQEANNSVPFNILVAAFLHESAKGRIKHKGKMMETGTGGSKEQPKPKSDKISLEEAAVLMQTDYKKWKQYVTEGKIDMTSIA